MPTRQRTGIIGCTNRGEYGVVERHQRPYGHLSPQYRVQQTLAQASTVEEPNIIKPWSLPIIQQPSSAEVPIQRPREDCTTIEQIKATLGANIQRYQHESKSFKSEPWYHSPIGAGSSSSVLHAAFTGLDLHGTGYIQRKAITKTLGSAQFGLRESEIGALLSNYNIHATDDSANVPYKSFVRSLNIPETTDTGNDIIFRRETYIERVRRQASDLLEQNAHKTTHGSTQPNWPATVTPSVPPRPPGTERIVPSRTKLPNRLVEVDKLSYQYDKERRERRMEAKSRALLAHINRMEEYAQFERERQEYTDRRRLASVAMNNVDYHSRILEGERAVIRVEEKRGKGLLKCSQTQAKYGTSPESMFFHQTLRAKDVGTKLPILTPG